MVLLFPSSLGFGLDSFEFVGWAESPTVRYIEIAFDKTTGSPRVEQGTLNGGSLSQWLDKDFGREDASSRAGGLRLVLVGKPDSSASIKTVPLPRPAFQSILQKFSLPVLYLATKKQRAARCIMREHSSSTGEKFLSFISRNDIEDPSSHMMGITYNVQTCVTSAIMIRFPAWIKVYIAFITERADLANNPSFLILVTAHQDFNNTETNYEKVRTRTTNMEKAIGHTATFIQSTPGNLKELDLPETTKSLNLLASTIAVTEKTVKIQLKLIKRIMDFQRRILEEQFKDHDIKFNTGAQEMKHFAEWMEDSWLSMLLEYECYSKSVQGQIAIIYSYTTQRDSALNVEIAKDSKSIATASKRDSTAMKSIALLTMLFLPATFVSSLFAMPLFNWSADGVSEVVTRHAWIYLAVTLPLTIVVLFIWIGWLVLSERMHRTTDESVRASLSTKKGGEVDNKEIPEKAMDAKDDTELKSTWFDGFLRHGRNWDALKGHIRLRKRHGEVIDEEQ